MEKFFAYQKDSRVPCKYGRKCFQTNKEHTDKYKHPPTKDDIEEDNKKTTRKRDSKGKVKSSNKTDGESSNSNHMNNPDEESFNSGEINDMEVPERPEQTISTSSSEPNSIPSTSNQQNSTEYTVPSMRHHSQQQQQLLFTNSTLEDCSIDDGIVPSTPTLFTPRRLDGETVSSPHVPSSNQIQRFTFVGESQPSQIPDLNDREQPDPPVQNVTDSDYLKTKISELFLVEEMPKEFYDLWSFCKRQSPSHPEDALLSVGLKLVGPYDVLAGHMNGFNANDVEKTVLHWRYYYDPPEFQTILASTGSEFHIGYFRDVPLGSPVFVVSNDSSENCVIKKLGKSLFKALRKHLHSMDSKEANTLQKKLLAYEIRKVTEVLEGRKCHPVTKTFHKAGIVVPYDSRTDIGYRPLSESEYCLQQILKSYLEASESKKMEAMDKLQPIINYANIASDECDFGTAFELGIDFFCNGNPDLHRICRQLLVTAYNLLRRPQFATIIKAHLNNRRKGPNMSIL
ncbi:histone PARylation factor 1 [Rhopalosiphum padi]|uniref:histone PARylation factor 1 n=1 Tax=Rhopalosiphum padi TaxID=40932 RepID=UPI00298E024A|nr:histone PARylation factor 1 [Rhopalosiphum padi]XP_060851101.1 histone PARylation factor 1 [Rhopalosiphum padi]